MRDIVRCGAGWSVLAAASCSLVACFLTRLGSSLEDDCSIDQDCPAGEVCWDSPSGSVRLCRSSAYAACMDEGSSHEECRELLDAGTPDFGLPDAGDLDAASDADGPSDDPGQDPNDGDLADMESDADGDSPPEPPVAQPDTYPLTGGSTLIEPDPGVLANDATFGGPLRAVREAQPSHGSLALEASGGFVYVHDDSQSTTDTFSYRAVDGALVSEPVTVTLLINIAPNASDQNVIIPQDEAIAITLEASDANEDVLTYAIVEGPDHGGLTDFDELAGTVTYTPEGDFTGVDVFTFVANDGELDSSAARVTLSVNGAPGFDSLPAVQSTLAGQIVGPLQITIVDPNDDPGDLTLSATSDREDIVPGGSIGITGTGTDRALTLITEPDTAGIVTLTLSLSDGISVVTAGVTVHVGVTNDLDDVSVPGSIRRALDIAQSEDTITFDPDHFDELASEAQRTITLQSQLDIATDLIIHGPGQELLTLSGNNTVRILAVSEGVSLTLRELTLSGGSAQGEDAAGGAIYNDGGDVTLANASLSDNYAEGDGGGIFNANSGLVMVTNSTLSGNSADRGGGAIVNDDRLTVTNSTLSGNSADRIGGAIENSGQLTVTNSTLSGNSADSDTGGGAIFNSGQLAVTNSTIANNTAAYGGGIYHDSGESTIANSTISSNSVGVGGSGGGIYNDNGQLAITNSTISNNTADYGGGILQESGPLTVTNSTIVANRADPDGDGLGVGGGISTFATPMLAGTIVVANLRGSDTGTPDEIESPAGLDASSAYNLIGDADSAGNLANGVNGNIVGVDWTTVLDPTLIGNGGPTQTHALLPSSPAVDHIPAADCEDPKGIPIETDQRGEARPSPSGGACDIGAFERQPDDP